MLNKMLLFQQTRKDTMDSTLYLVGKEAKTKEYVKGTMPCMFCKRFIINAGISKIVVRDSKMEYRIIDVNDFIENDDSLSGVTGY